MQLPEFQLHYVNSAVSFPGWKEKDLFLKQADRLQTTSFNESLKKQKW